MSQPTKINHTDDCTCGKCSEANAMLAKAKTYMAAEKYGLASRYTLKAIVLLEKIRPLNQNMADAYRQMCDALALKRARKKGERLQLDLEAIAWYEKTITVLEGIGDVRQLRGNLTNLGSFYYGLGDYETSLKRELRGLDMERSRDGEKSVTPWNHVSSCYLKLGRLDEAEATIRDGFMHCGDNTPMSGYLWNTLAEITKARAVQYRKRAEELVPAASCSIG